MMSKWIPWMMAAAALAFTGCKKSDPAKTEAPVADTAAALPAPPELEPVDELFADTTPAEPAPTPKPAARPTPSAGLKEGGAYTLQVGIFANERQAGRLADKLKAQGFPAYVTRVQDPKPSMPGTYYRVRVGSFASSQAARAYGAANLAPQGIDYWADLKGRDTQPVNPVYKPKTLPPPPAPAAPEPSASTPAPAAPAASNNPAPAASSPAPAAPAPAKQDAKPAPSLPDW